MQSWNTCSWAKKKKPACLQTTGLQCVLGGVAPNFPRLGYCMRAFFGCALVETRFACCRAESSQLVMGHSIRNENLSIVNSQGEIVIAMAT